MRDSRSTELLFDLSKSGRRAAMLPPEDVPAVDLEEMLGSALHDSPLELPELSELDVVRHFVNLSVQNMSIDSTFYPLGSCTMKYNPKRHERLAALPGIVDVHPLQDDSTIQGFLELLYLMQQILGEIAGLPGVSLQPAAGAHGEMTALLVAAAYFRDQGQKRTKVLIPDSAHGTNPASAVIAGFDCVTVPSNRDGMVSLDHFKKELGSDVAAFMITNPNTLGLFDRQIETISKLLKENGSLMYLDGANMNAILGVTRPGDFGADMMHYNVHKTFTGPHGAGGPGSGPIAVRDFLEPYLPSPVVVQEKTDGQTRYRLDDDRPMSIGRVRGFFGNVGILVRGYNYIRTLGPEGLRRVSDNAVLNANYLRTRLKQFFPVPYGTDCMHEFVATAVTADGLENTLELWNRRHMLSKKPAISAMDIAKRLIDYGYHSPTVYFPLVVPEAIMVEPTETECKETLDAFADTMIAIKREDPEFLHNAPHTTSVSRPDEVRAARQPVVRWRRAETSPAD